jgi:nuclear transport factor 2 (NTF2) superfamily protein
VLDREGREVERASLIADLTEPESDRVWWWDIAPAPEAHPETSERRRVVARFVPGAAAFESL